ncbi:MAG: hypothetical protein LKI42_05135 [Bacteroidales bacterium]|nr:hypothetical protein [Bacteroidales bacterium]MCI1786322.1 hypothetical protein [Bacteroidales bacterium]
MYSIEDKENETRCLECGNIINYGRNDKKFCCEKCKNRYNYKLHRRQQAVKNKIIGSLLKNYTILESILRQGMDSVDFNDLVQMGFNPEFSTSYHRVGKHDEFRCFDIKYFRFPSRISNIGKTFSLLPIKRR